MIFEDYINKYLTESNIGDEIEDLDANVDDKDRKKFDKVLEKALNKVDPKNNLSIKDAVMKMRKIDAKRLLDDLMAFNYKE